MITGILLLGALLFLLLAVHPFATYPLSLLLIHRILPVKPIQAAPDALAAPRFAILTCAYNEERAIEAKIRNSLSLREKHPTLQILVYVDAASDRTAAIASQFADQISLHVSPERHGKTYGMNLLVRNTDAEILVFTDANVMLEVNALDQLVPYFSDPAVGCVCGNLNYVNPDASITARTGSLYWRLEESLKRMETDLGSMMGADGSIFAARRALHHPPPAHIIDDMFVSFNILCDGYRVVQARDVSAYEESVSAPAEEFRRKIRIACQAFNVHRLIWRRIRAQRPLVVYMYVSHKLLRWFSIYFLTASFALFIAGIAHAGYSGWALGLVLASALLLFIGLRWSVPLLSQAADILVALCGAGMGVWRSLRGEFYQTWKPAASIRK